MLTSQWSVSSCPAWSTSDPDPNNGWENDPCPWPLLPMWAMLMKHLASSHCSHLGSAPVDGRSHCISPYLLVNSTFNQINEKNLKNKIHYHFKQLRGVKKQRKAVEVTFSGHQEGSQWHLTRPAKVQPGSEVSLTLPSPHSPLESHWSHLIYQAPHCIFSVPELFWYGSDQAQAAQLFCQLPQNSYY